MSNPKNEKFLEQLNKPQPPAPEKKYTDNASYDHIDGPSPWRDDPNKTDFAD